MSKARLVLVITAVVIEGRSQSAVAREYGVSQGWISRLVTRYRLEGEAAFEPRSRRPHSSPTRLPQTTVDLIVELRNKLRTAGLDSGPHTIAWHLEHHHQLQVSVASISRHPGRGRTDHPNTGETSQVLLHSLRRRTTQRTLAGRLHSLVARRQNPHRNPDLAR